MNRKARVTGKAKKVGPILKTWMVFYLIQRQWQQNDRKKERNSALSFLEELSTASCSSKARRRWPQWSTRIITVRDLQLWPMCKLFNQRGPQWQTRNEIVCTHKLLQELVSRYTKELGWWYFWLWRTFSFCKIWCNSTFNLLISQTYAGLNSQKFFSTSGVFSSVSLIQFKELSSCMLFFLYTFKSFGARSNNLWILKRPKCWKLWVMFGSVPKFSLEKTYPMQLADEWLQFRSYFWPCKLKYRFCFWGGGWALLFWWLQELQKILTNSILNRQETSKKHDYEPSISMQIYKKLVNWYELTNGFNLIRLISNFPWKF